jgi:nitronate monooxygenase
MGATRFTALVGCRFPIQQAGIGGVATPELAVAVARAGGLGMLGMHTDPLIDRLDALGQASPVGVNFLMPFLPSLDDVELAASRVRVVEFFYGDPEPLLVERVHGCGALAAWQVGSVDEGRAAVDAGCDFVIAQGVEAGGHVRGTTPRQRFIGELTEAVDVPVVAAGGITTAEDVAVALDEGADAVRVGTRFLATRQSGAHPRYIAALLRAHDANDTVLTTAFEVGWAAPHRVLRSAVAGAQHLSSDVAGHVGSPDGSPVPRWSAAPPTPDVTGTIEAMALYAGAGVGAVTSIGDAGDVVRELAAGARPSDGR